MTNDQKWADRFRGAILTELRLYLSRPKMGRRDLEEKIGEFISAFTERKHLTGRQTKRVINAVLLHDLPQWLQAAAVAPDDQKWDEIFFLVEGRLLRVREDEDQASGLIAPELVTDVQESFEAVYEREQALSPEELLHEVEKDALRRVALRMPALLTALRERMIVAPRPIYLLMEREPYRYQFLLVLFHLLGAEVFESLMESCAGTSVRVPVLTDLKREERMRRIVSLNAQGHNLRQIGAQMHCSPARVSQLLKEWRTTRRSDTEMTRALLPSLNKAIRVLMGAHKKSDL